jgi:hypothetical protein
LNNRVHRRKPALVAAKRVISGVMKCAPLGQTRFGIELRKDSKHVLRKVEKGKGKVFAEKERDG